MSRTRGPAAAWQGWPRRQSRRPPSTRVLFGVEERGPGWESLWQSGKEIPVSQERRYRVSRGVIWCRRTTLSRQAGHFGTRFGATNCLIRRQQQPSSRAQEIIFFTGSASFRLVVRTLMSEPYRVGSVGSRFGSSSAVADYSLWGLLRRMFDQRTEQPLQESIAPELTLSCNPTDGLAEYHGRFVTLPTILDEFDLMARSKRPLPLICNPRQLRWSGCAKKRETGVKGMDDGHLTRSFDLRLSSLSGSEQKIDYVPIQISRWIRRRHQTGKL